jgi:hypothetical protein
LSRPSTRADTADACGVRVRIKTFGAKSVKATAAGIVASAEAADADLRQWHSALPERGAPLFGIHLERQEDGLLAALKPLKVVAQFSNDVVRSPLVAA